MNLFVLHKEENGDKDKLNRAKVKGQVRLGENTAVKLFVGVGVVENFNQLGNHPAVEENGDEETEVLFSNVKEECGDEDCGDSNQNEVISAKQSRIGRENGMHKNTSLVKCIENIIA